MSKYDTMKLADMGFGDITFNGPAVELSESEVADLANLCADPEKARADIETARI